jgi:hypothetical protein
MRSIKRFHHATIFALLGGACAVSCEDLADGDGGGDVLLGDAVIESDADVARVSSYRRITGDLVLSQALGGRSLELAQLEQVAGSVRVQELTVGADGWTLSLPQLQRVGLNLAVADIEGQVTLKLPALTFVGGHLDLARGTFRLDAPALQAVNGRLAVWDCRIQLDDLSALETIGGGLLLKRFSPLDGDVSLQTTFRFPALRSVSGDLELRQTSKMRFEAPVLTTLGGSLRIGQLELDLHLPALSQLAEDLSIRVARLPTLVLDALREVGGDIALNELTIGGHEAIRFRELTTVAHAIDIQRLGDASRLEFPRLKTVGAWIRIRDSSKLARVELPVLVGTESDIVLSRNGSLVPAMPLLEVVGGDLELAGNNQLAASFPQLVTVVGSLRVQSTVVTRLELPSLAEIQRDLDLDQVTWQTARVALPALQQVDGTLALREALYLQQLALARLTQVGGAPGGIARGSLVIEDNRQLVELSFPAIASVAVDLVIRDNPQLDTEALAMQLESISVGREPLARN